MDESVDRKGRAGGIRDRIMTYLLAAGEVTDPGGTASVVLAKAVGYPGSSIAFARLLSRMERAGLIEREIRGRRTYQIVPAAATLACGPLRASVSGSLGEFDYDELARRLLILVGQRLAVAIADVKPYRQPARALGAGPAGGAALQQAMAILDRKLAFLRARQWQLAAENAGLLVQLRAAQESLADAQERLALSGLLGHLDAAGEVFPSPPLHRPQQDGPDEAGTD